jgi:hypothetical protein
MAGREKGINYIDRPSKMIGRFMPLASATLALFKVFKFRKFVF